ADLCVYVKMSTVEFSYSDALCTVCENTVCVCVCVCAHGGVDVGVCVCVCGVCVCVCVSVLVSLYHSLYLSSLCLFAYLSLFPSVSLLSFPLFLSSSSPFLSLSFSLIFPSLCGRHS